MRTRLGSLLLAVLCTLLLGAADDPPGAAPGAPPARQFAECLEAITPKTADTLFAALKTPSSDGCTLEGVTTRTNQIAIQWKKDGKATDPVLVQPAGCTKGATTSGEVLSLIVPAPARAACPTAVAAVESLVRGGALGDTFKEAAGGGAAPSSAPRPTTYIALAAIVVLAAVAAVILRGRKPAVPAAAAGPTEASSPPVEAVREPAEAPVAAPAPDAASAENGVPPPAASAPITEADAPKQD